MALSFEVEDGGPTDWFRSLSRWYAATLGNVSERRKTVRMNASFQIDQLSVRLAASC
jgi:hypothetical protein